MKDITILAIETSCDESACAIVRNGKTILSNVVATQIDVHEKFGGVLPEVASRLHVEQISAVIEEAIQKANIRVEDVDAIAYTRGPGLIGSLHVGVQAAKTLAFAFNKPLIPIHHMRAHIFANYLIEDLKFPLLALVVSGGHSEIVYMKDTQSYEIIGQSQDDAIGEAYDKVARVMGLGYPGGPKIDALAVGVEERYPLPKVKVEGIYDYSFSGLKSGVLQLIDRRKRNGEEMDPKVLAASFQATALDQIMDKLMKAVNAYEPKQVVLAGGVAANKDLRRRMEEAFTNRHEEIILPPLWCCTDNAAMVAVAGYFVYLNNAFGDFSQAAKPNLSANENK